MDAPYNEVWRGNGAVLRGRKDLGLSVDRTGGRESDLADAAVSHRLQHLGGGDRVLLEIERGVLQAVANVGVRLEMEDPVAPVHRLAQDRSVAHIPLDERGPGPLEEVGEELPSPGPEVVDHHDLGPSRGKAISQVASNEPGSAGDARALHRWHGGPQRSRPAAAASRWNIRTVSNENSARSRPSPPNLASRSLVIVMMWQPT